MASNAIIPIVTCLPTGKIGTIARGVSRAQQFIAVGLLLQLNGTSTE